MNKIQFDNNNFILYAPDSLSHVYKNLERILDERLELYKGLFDVDSFHKVEIYYFDNKEEFHQCLRALIGEEAIPEYATGSFYKGNIYAYIDPSIKETDDMFTKREHLAAHELYHIMSEELIYSKTRQERITWFEEGCAQFFSGEKEREITTDFADWFRKVKTETKEIPELNNLAHGSEFKTDDYNGYDLSLLAVKNLYDRLGYECFKRIMTNSSSILRNGEGIIEESFLFYGISLGTKIR